jgi:hypothetical protein
MKCVVCLVVIAVFRLNGCENLSRHHHRQQETKAPRTGVISRNETSALVDTTWMLTYKLLESKHGTIPEDAQIYMEGKQYRIPQAVSHHLDDMKGAE